MYDDDRIEKPGDLLGGKKRQTLQRCQAREVHVHEATHVRDGRHQRVGDVPVCDT